MSNPLNNGPMTPEEYRAQRLAQYTQRPAQYNPFDMQTMNNESLAGLQQDAMTPTYSQAFNPIRLGDTKFNQQEHFNFGSNAGPKKFSGYNNPPGLDNNRLLTSLQDEAMAPYMELDNNRLLTSLQDEAMAPYLPSNKAGDVANSLGGTAAMSGNPYLMAAGGVAKIYGAYQDRKRQDKMDKEEQRRYEAERATQGIKLREGMGQRREAHNMSMDNAETARRNAKEDRYLQMANYKGRH